jgi:hypothetical protein
MSLPPLFGALIIDRDPYVLSDAPGLIQAYLQDVGGFLFIGLLFYFLIILLRPTQAQATEGKNTSSFMLLCVAVAILCYAGYGALVMVEWSAPGKYGADRLNLKPQADATGYVKVVTPKFSLLGYTDKQLPPYVQPFFEGRQPYPWQALLLTFGGLFSLLGAAAPFAVGLKRLRWRRIWAISVLSIKEVIRNKVFLAFLIVLIPLMFPITWFLPFKAEDELRMGVKWVGTLVAVLLLLASVVMSAFALPNDVKSQNIYTIVTKPVERFEIVLGRFIGYVCLFTLATLAVGLLTLTTLIFSNPSAQAQEETQKARVALRGTLQFLSRKADFVGTDVGREFNYRRYIGGDPTSSQRAVYEFLTAPSSLRNAPEQKVPVEFSFDIFRLTKGEENKGVDVNVRIVSWQCGQKPPATDERTGEWQWTDLEAKAAYIKDAVAELKKLPKYAGNANDPNSGVNNDKAVNVLRTSEPGTQEWEVANLLAKKYGYYEYAGKQVYDFHPEKVFVPSGVFENAAADKSGAKEVGTGPRVRVYIHCTTPSQMLGMAEGDLYILEQERSFGENYLKSTFGLWCWLVLVIGLCVTLSTYLDAVVTLLAVLFLFVTAFFASYILELGQNIGRGQSGPFASLNQLLQAKQPTAEAQNTATEKAADFLDLATKWGFRRVVNVLPDVDAFYWTHYVSEGFNVSFEYLLLNFGVLVAYLFPWFLLSYYLIRGREVAA